MKSFILSLAMICICISVSAQEKPAAYAVSDEYNLWNFQKSDTAYVFADMAYVRDNPSLNSKIIDSISEGNLVIIHSEGYNDIKIRGFSAPWHEIIYVKDNQQKKGFIWLGLLALNGSKNKDGELFIYGFKKFRIATENDSQYYESELKVFNTDQRLITKEIFHATVDGQMGTETKILSGMSLQEIKNIHRIAFLSEACGTPTLYYYFAWNGKNLIHFPEKMSVSDAGVFYHDETILFPSEHKGDPKMIYKNIIDGENIEEDLDNPKFKETKSQKKYSWDGKVLSEIISFQ